MADGRVLYERTRAEASVRFLFPGHAPSSFVRTSRFLGRLSGALDFATGAYTQWQEDEGIPLEERLLRAGTKGSGLLGGGILGGRSEEHTYELQSLMRISYDVFCLKKHNNL